MHRDYEPIGEEALAPPTTQNAFALFGLQTIDFEHAALQFGGRFTSQEGIDSRRSIRIRLRLTF